MAIKSGQFLHDSNGFVIDRIQTGGVSNLNIPQEKIYELGNYQTVATIRDIPDLSFELESLDTSTEIEALLLAKDPTTVALNGELDLNKAIPMDVVSPFKSGNGNFDIVRGVAVPSLTLESAAYRFGLRQNSTQTFTLRGDAVYYIPGTPYTQQYAGGGTGFSFTNTALPYVEKGVTQYALSVGYFTTTGTYKRLFHTVDYTDSPTGVTLLEASPAGSTVKVVYGSATAATYPQTVHQDATVKPAAIRGKDIDVYIAAGGATPGVLTRWASVQSFECNWRVNVENDEEFGNSHAVSSDYDTAELSGNIVVKPRDAEELVTKIQQIANVPTTEIAGALTAAPMQVELRINHPDTGVRVKTLYISDARFTVPAIQGQVQQKLNVTFPFESDSGKLLVYRGARV